MPKINVLAPSQGAMTSLLNDHQQNLAIELAANLQEPKEILARYNITKKDFKVLATTAQFKKQFADAKIAWGSASNTKERISLKAAMMSEAALLTMNQLLHDSSTPPSNRIDLHKHISTLGAVMPSRSGGEGDVGSKHSIIINLHNPKEAKEIKVVNATGSVIEHGEK